MISMRNIIVGETIIKAIIDVNNDRDLFGSHSSVPSWLDAQDYELPTVLSERHELAEWLRHHPDWPKISTTFLSQYGYDVETHFAYILGRESSTHLSANNYEIPRRLYERTGLLRRIRRIGGGSILE